MHSRVLALASPLAVAALALVLAPSATDAFDPITLTVGTTAYVLTGTQVALAVAGLAGLAIAKEKLIFASLSRWVMLVWKLFGNSYDQRSSLFLTSMGSKWRNGFKIKPLVRVFVNHNFKLKDEAQIIRYVASCKDESNLFISISSMEVNNLLKAQFPLKPRSSLPAIYVDSFSLL